MSKTKLITHITILVVGTLVIELAASRLRSPANRRAPTEEVVASYLNYSRQGNIEKIESLTTAFPKSFDEYQRRQRLLEIQSTGSTDNVLIPRAAKMSDQTLMAVKEKWPEIFGQQSVSQLRMVTKQTWMNESDAKVTVTSKFPSGQKLQWNFFLHRDEDRWRNLLIDHASYIDNYPTS